MQWITAVLDSRLLARLGNLQTLFRVAALGVFVVIGAILAVLEIGPWWPVVASVAAWVTAMLVVSVATRRSRVVSAAPDVDTPANVVSGPEAPGQWPPSSLPPGAINLLEPVEAAPLASSHVLRDQLQDFYNEGARIREGMPQPMGAGEVVRIVSRARSGQADTTREDVEKWEAATTALLRDRAEWRYWFTSDPPATPRDMMMMNETPLRRLMTHRLRQLARIIERTDGPMR